MKLSIITINRNNADGLCKTMESVLAQTCRDFEYIIVDGASTDESVEIIREHESSNALNSNPLIFKWISEPDTGIYNAMNKGLKMAHGEYTLMLNSGDYLVDEHMIERIMPELHTEDMIQGNIIINYSDKMVRHCGYGRSDISFLDAMEANFLHQAMFIKLRTMAQYGYYDEAYKRSSDSYFFITALALGNATFRYVDIDVANFDPNGISSNIDPKWAQIEEVEDARWFGEHISQRLSKHCKDASQAISVYHALYQNKWIGRMTNILLKLSHRINPVLPKLKIETISEE